MRMARHGFTLIELMIVVAIIGILAAIAVPNFIKFQAKSKQSEARANLKALFTAQKAFYQEKDHFSSITAEVGFAPERNNRYTYFAANGCTDLEIRDNITPTTTATNCGISADEFKGFYYQSTTVAPTCTGT